VNEQPWYADGLRFECTRCGNCCTGPTGTVRVSDEEQRALAALLGLGQDEFRARYTRPLEDGAHSLTEKPSARAPDTWDCVFLAPEGGCSVYPARPRQCRTWPFWRASVATRAHWAAAATGCPGIDRGALHDAATIARTAAQDGTSGIVPAPGDLGDLGNLGGPGPA